MKIYKIAQDTNLTDMIEKIFIELARMHPEYHINRDTITGKINYIECDYHDVGQAYIQVSYDRVTGAFSVEKYYEDELLQNEYGKVISVSVKSSIPDTVVIINTAIGQVEEE